METGPAWSRRETIETTISAFGAGFVGLGVGLVLGIKSARFGWPILLGGIVLHALGMVHLHRRRQGHGNEAAEVVGGRLPGVLGRAVGNHRARGLAGLALGVVQSRSVVRGLQAGPGAAGVDGHQTD
ncbi:MAG: hypothetical protein AABY18_02125 [Candidatus Thermoplasmatota archaeon]